jgi:hypothetical protein
MNISNHLFVAIFLLCIVACQKKSEDGDRQVDSIENSPNQELYDEVMRIHDEVMPKMNDLYKARTALKTRMELPGLPENERLEIGNNLARLDSASEGMMVWMRQFDPLPDSAGEEKARTYLESELEKIKRVREDIVAALKTSASGD